VRFEVLAVVFIKIKFFCDRMPCEFVNIQDKEICFNCTDPEFGRRKLL
jgi:hypothetical protein